MGGGSSIRLEDLLSYLQNPHENLEQIRKTSIYLTNKHGVLKDVLRMIKTLPTLRYSLNWAVEDTDDIEKYEKEVVKFLRDIEVVKFIRDGLYEVALLGTVVPVLRSKKYIQFLELDEIKIEKMRNGKWVVEYDLSSLDTIRNTNDVKNKIDSLPDEVTLRRYLNFRDKKDESLQFVELKNCEVISLDALRNSPFGLPYTIGAWYAILQKELINQVEKSVSERLLTQILILKAGHFDKEGNNPVTDDVVAPYFKGVEDVLRTKDMTAKRNQNNVNSSGLIQIPYFLDLSALNIDATMFEKDLYDKLDDDLYSSLGVSRAMIFGEGGNYSSAQVNSEKIFSTIFSLVEQFEGVLNSFIKTLLPDNVVCEIKFDKSTVLDKQTEIKHKKELYQQTSIFTPWIESVMNMPIDEVVKLREYEIKNNLSELFFPAPNAHTMSSDKEVGRPENDEAIEKDDTIRSRGSGANNNPSPSDE